MASERHADMLEALTVVGRDHLSPARFDHKPDAVGYNAPWSIVRESLVGQGTLSPAAICKPKPTIFVGEVGCGCLNNAPIEASLKRASLTLGL